MLRIFSPSSILSGYLDADLGRRLQLLEMHFQESREEAGFFKTELTSVTGKLTRAMYDIAQDREWRERDKCLVSPRIPCRPVTTSRPRDREYQQ